MNRKFNIDSAKPTPSEIKSMSDFEGALGEYRQARNAKRFKIGSASIAGIAAIVALAWWLTQPAEFLTVHAEAPEIEESTTSPTFGNFETPYEQFTIQTERKNCVITEDGVIIVIDAHSFETSDSTLELRYKPLNNPVAIANEGISMAYDSGQTKYDFETAGMFELIAKSSNGEQPLQTTKNVQVYYPKEPKKENFNAYTYSRELRSWSFVERAPELPGDEVCEKLKMRFDNSPAAQVSDSLQQEIGLKSKLYSLRGNDLPEPRKPNKDNYRFNLDVVASEFPELAEFSDVEFEVIDPRFSYAHFNKTWDSAKVIKASYGKYIVKLKEGRKEVEFNVYPVFEGAEFEAKYQQYLTDVAKKKEHENQLLKDIAHLEEELKANLSKSAGLRIQDDEMALVRAALAGFEPSDMYFKINMPSLGVCNLDTPISIPKGTEIMAEFYILAGDKKTRLAHVTLVDLDKDQYYEYPHTRMKEFRYKPRHRNLLVAITPKGELAIADPTKFDVIDTKMGQHMFFLDVLETYPSEEELMAIFETQREGV